MNTARINYENSVCTRNDGPVCCDTESVREASMAENLANTQDLLVNAVNMLQQLDGYIFGTDANKDFDIPKPPCMRDAIFNNEYLSDLVVIHLKKLVDRICK